MKTFIFQKNASKISPTTLTTVVYYHSVRGAKRVFTVCENRSGVELDLMEFRNWEICHCSGDLMDCIYFSHLQLGFKFILIFDDFS